MTHPPGHRPPLATHPPEDWLSLCQAALEVRQSTLEVRSTWAMGLGSGPGEDPEGLPVKGQADRGALVDIEGDGIGQQCDRVVELAGRIHSSARAAVERASPATSPSCCCR